MKTKEKIALTALALFSERGYSASSIRDICKAVGIKESSLYYHFENKQAILDSLRERFCRNGEKMMTGLEKAVEMAGDITRDGFLQVTRGFVEQYLLEDFTNRFLRILILEQAQNQDLRLLYREWLFERPVQFQSALFQRLMELGFFRQGDSESLAVAYYAPVLFFYLSEMTCGELNEARKQSFLGRVQRQTIHFLKENGRETDG